MKEKVAKRNILVFLHCILLFFSQLFFSCAKKKKDSPSIRPKLNTLMNNSNANKDRINAKSAKIKLSKKITLKSIDTFGNAFQFPHIENIEMGNSDFLQILRCNAGYEMKTLQGQKVSELDMKAPNVLVDIEWAWALALGDNRNCKLASTYANGNSFADYTAESGKYYYILNPCVSSKRSLSRREECSFQIQTTNKFSYTAELRNEILEKK